ncbi:MAG TPA: PilN domain-containing protein, partial [Capillimicrobium sp.]
MKAVNLIPAEERRGGGAGALSGLSGPTLGLLGLLLVALLAVVAWVSVSNGVAEREDELARVEANATSAEQRAAALKPYGDVAALRAASERTVAALDATRFDWAALLGDLARRVPADVTLATLNGSLPDPTTVAVAATDAGGESAVPTITLTGCTSDHAAVARMMERMRAVRGVADVALASSDRDGTAGGAASGG